MKSIRRYLVIVFALVMALSMTVTAYGASGKQEAYLLTKHTNKAYDTDGVTVDDKTSVKYKYDKHGLLKSVRYSDSYGAATKGTFVYNKKKQIIKMNTTEYYDGEKGEKHCYKYSYNKNGYIRRVRVYWIDNGRSVLLRESRLTWNKKGQLTKSRELTAKGKVESITYYRYNKKGQLVKKYFSDAPSVQVWTYDGDKGTMIEYASKAKKEIHTVNYQTYKNGNLVEDTMYGDLKAENKWSTDRNYYKTIKVSSKYKRLIRRQQAFLQKYGFI